jgi:hypothetical protein
MLKMKKRIVSLCLFTAFVILSISACQKDNDPTGVPPTVDSTGKCADFNFRVSSSSKVDNGVAVRSITVTATGGTNILYKINTDNYQPNGTFSNLNTGVYKVSAKNNEGCVRESTVTF